MRVQVTNQTDMIIGVLLKLGNPTRSWWSPRPAALGLRIIRRVDLDGSARRGASWVTELFLAPSSYSSSRMMVSTRVVFVGRPDIRALSEAGIAGTFDPPAEDQAFAGIAGPGT
jgi:hypothetical protein